MLPLKRIGPLLLAATLGVVGSAQVEWLPLKLQAGRDAKSAAYFPGEVQQVRDTVATPLGRMPFTTYFHQDDRGLSGNRLYTLTLVEYADGAFPADSLARREAFFASTIAAAAESVGGEVTISERADLGERHGHLFRIDYGDERPTVVRNRAYLVGDTYVHLQVFSFREDDGARSRKRFFESLRPGAVVAARARPR